MTRLVPLICLTNIFGALTLASILWGAVPRWQLLGWMAVLLAVTASVRGLGTARKLPETVSPTRGMGGIMVRSALLGVLWAVPAAVFSGTGTMEQQLGICLISAGIMASAAMTSATVPPATLFFVGAASTGLTLMMAKTGSPLLTALPGIYGVSIALGGLSSGRDFLVRRSAELALAEKNEVVSLLLREFEENGADWLWQVDTAKRLHHVSARLARAAERDPTTLEGLSLLELLAGSKWPGGETPPELEALVDRLNARESFSDLRVPVEINGEHRWWNLSAAPRVDDRGNFIGFRGVGSDVTEQKRSAEKIDRMARFDGLTGLANRLQLTDALRKALARAFRAQGRCALLLIDLDKFKAVNDTLGHPVGDKLLKLVAKRISGLLDDGDLCARLGGDEFAIVIADARDNDRLERLGAAIVDMLGQPFEVDHNLLHIGGSVGIAIGPKDGRSVEMIMRNADLALYRAKDDGRGCHRRFEPAFLARAEKRRAIELALREALDNDQFSLAYQPMFRGDTGQIAGFEALLRWTHPQLGEVPPDDFIPIAEEARLLPRIGEWVLRTACEEARSWPTAIGLSINLSAEQLFDPQLPATVMMAISSARIAPNRLEFEISEQLLLRENSAAVAALDRLRSLGVRVALDDFGTGYAMLGYAKPMRFSSIKIDRAFIAGAAMQVPESLAIVRAIVAMADSLGVVTTAEGTETQDEHALALALGCRQVQGFLSGRPMAAEDARALAAADRARRVA